MTEQYFQKINQQYIEDLFHEFDNNKETQEVVYHYTSKDTLTKILNSGTLRLSNVLYMNDPLEIKFGIDVIKHILYKYGKTNIEHFIDSYYSLITNHKLPLFIFSTSSEIDNHQQWIKYGDNGKGINIGFSRRGLFERLSSNKLDKLIYTYPILYYDSDFNLQNERIRNFELILSDKIGYLYNISKINNDSMYNDELFCLILVFSSLIKDSFHKEEKEWRYLVLTNTTDTNIESIVVDNVIKQKYCFKFAYKNQSQMGSNNFRSNYSFIKTIKLGPHIINSSITENEMYILLNQYTDFPQDNISRSRGYIQ